MSEDVTQDTVTPETPAPEAPVKETDSTASLTDAIAGAATGFESEETLESGEPFDPTTLAEPASDDDKPAEEAQPSSDSPAKEGEDKPTASEGEDSPDDDAPDGHSVDMPVVREGQENDVIQLTGLPQETADLMKHHFKQSARVPGLEAQLVQGQQDSTTIEFMQENPEDAMHWMEQAQPEAGEAFVRSWIARYSEKTLDLIADMGLAGMDAETMKTRSELERLRTENRIRDSQAKYDHTAQQRQTAALAGGVIRQIANTLNLDFSKLATETFVQACAAVLGKMPRTTTREEMTFALQDLTRQMVEILNHKPQTVAVGSPDGEKPPDDGQPRDDKTGQFKKKVDAMAKHRKLAGGRTTVTPINAIKQRGVGTIEEAIKRFRG